MDYGGDDSFDEFIQKYRKRKERGEKAPQKKEEV